MNVSDITDEELNRHLLYSGFELSDEKVDALIRAELSRRRAARAEKVGPVVASGPPCDYGYMCPTPTKRCRDCRAEHNSAKPKPASVAYAIEGVPATAGECAAFAQGVDAVKTAPIAVAGSGAARLLDADVRDARRKHLDSLDGDKPQTAGEGAIAIPTLADVPIGAVAVIRTAKAVWESLVVAKSAGYTFVGNSIKWPDTRIVERWYWPGNKENRMREGK